MSRLGLDKKTRKTPGCTRVSLLLPSLLLVLVSASPAAAASPTARERTARSACLAGDYKKGVAILSQLFVDTKDATYIYNQGRCFEQNGRYQEAITRFNEYLRVAKKLSEAYKIETQKHIDDCRALLPSENGRSAPASLGSPVLVQLAPVPAQPVYATMPSPQAPPYAASPVAVQASVQPTVRPGSGLRTAGIVTASVGGAALVAGIVFNVKANSAINNFQTVPNSYSPSKESDRQAYETAGWVSYGVGATCVAAGAVLYYLGPRSAGPATVAFLPAIGPGSALAAVIGGF